METRKKVLHFLPRNSFSGAENMVCQMIALFRGEMDMYYCCPEGPIRQALEERNIPYLPMAAFSVKEVRRLIRQEQPVSETAALNPDWVEWLMGFPRKWTDVSSGPPSRRASPVSPKTPQTAPYG